MSCPSFVTVFAIASSLLFVATVFAQDSGKPAVKITDPKLASINMGLDSSAYWLEKMKPGDERRGKSLLADLEKLATRFNRIPKSDDEQYKFIVDRFARLVNAIQAKSGQAKTTSSENATTTTQPSTNSSPHRNLFPLNKQLDGIADSLTTFDATNQKSVSRMTDQLDYARKLFSKIPASNHSEYLSAKTKLESIDAKFKQLTTQAMGTPNPRKLLQSMRKKYDKSALPRAQRMMSRRELTDEDVQTFLGQIAKFKTGIEKDLPQIKAAAASTGTASDLVSWAETESATHIAKEIDKLKMKLDRFIETAIKDAENLAGLDPEKNKFTFVTESVRKNNEDKFARAFRTMENAVSIEEAFGLPGRWSSRKDELEKHIAGYRRKAAEAATVKQLPAEVGDKKLAEIAKKTLAVKKYDVGEIERMIVNSKMTPRERIQTRFFNRQLETTIRKWDEFQVCTVEKEDGKYIVYFNTLKKFSRGPDTTPIGEWILSIRYKSGEIAADKLK